MLGIGVVEGVVIGKPYLFDDKVLAPVIGYNSPEQESESFLCSIEKVTFQIEDIIGRVSDTCGSENADIFDYQLLMLQDEDFVGKVSGLINDGKGAVASLNAVCDEYVKVFSEMDNDYMRQRTIDIEDIRKRLLFALYGKEMHSLSDIREEVVLAADDLTPSQTAGIDKSKIKGVLLENGGKSSHTVILARSMGIPCIIGLKGLFRKLADANILIMDGETGEIFINPDEELIEKYDKIIQSKEDEKKTDEAFKFVGASTTDGFEMRVFANIASKEEAIALVANGGDGSGLVRTEFIYMASGKLPEEEEQYRIYAAIASELEDRPLIIRTLDIGGDKDLPYLGITSEPNPFLGYRAIRFSLDNLDIFRRQIAAILRAGADGNVSMMFPMISTISELRSAKSVVESVRTELDKANVRYGNVPVGIMIETPAAAVMAESLAKEVDFFSIGTNDLTQYLFAADRNNSKVSHLNSYFHPALLKTVAGICAAAKKNGIHTDICGQAGEIPELVPMWIAMGVNNLSVSVPSIPKIKRIICETNRADAITTLEKVLQIDTSMEAESLLKNYLHKKRW